MRMNISICLRIIILCMMFIYVQGKRVCDCVRPCMCVCLTVFICIHVYI